MPINYVFSLFGCVFLLLISTISAVFLTHHFSEHQLVNALF